MKEIISAQEAGRILMIPSQAVREHIKRKIPPFDRLGYCIPKEKLGNRYCNQYLVYTRQLLNFFGITEEEAERRMA